MINHYFEYELRNILSLFENGEITKNDAIRFFKETRYEFDRCINDEDKKLYQKLFDTYLRSY